MIHYLPPHKKQKAPVYAGAFCLGTCADVGGMRGSLEINFQAALVPRIVDINMKKLSILRMQIVKWSLECAIIDAAYQGSFCYRKEQRIQFYFRKG